MKNVRLLTLLVVVRLASFIPATAQSTTEKPNILLIMADDMGFSDLGCYGSEINTPTIDRLANEGIRLRRCYNNSVCAPSRASLLTGQYPHKAGIGFFNINMGIPAYQGYLKQESLTLGEVFKNGGYSTHMSGKWHVGNEQAHWPLQRGFDNFFGFIDGGFSFWDSNPIVKGSENTSSLYLGNDEWKITDKNHYLTDELTTRALSFLAKAPKEKPFFLYMAYNAPHWPLHAKPGDIAKYKGKYDIGWDSLRVVRFQNLQKMGLIAPNQSPVRDNSIPNWNKLTYDEKQFWSKKMEVYAAMVDNLDQNIGRLIQYYPSSLNNIRSYPLAGKSFVANIKQNDWPLTTPLFFEREGQRAVWWQNWKIVSTYPANKWELYDLKADRAEARNLADTNPETVRKMEEMYTRWASSNEVAEWNQAMINRVRAARN